MQPQVQVFPTHFKAGQFKVEQVLGQGGFGVTYLALDQVLGRRVAVKELFVSGSSRDSGGVLPPPGMTPQQLQDLVDGFVEEARALARFAEPNVVRILEIFEENRTAYIVMEFIQGQTLSARLGFSGTSQRFHYSKPLLPGEVNRLARTLALALQKVHGAGLLHLDLKPDNIFLSSADSPVLIDFGGAKSHHGGLLTQGTVLTHCYAPPEQYIPNAPKGAFSDVYALAATLYACLTGLSPLPAFERMQAGGLLEPLPLETPPRLLRAIQGGLELDPTQRLRSAEAFLDVLGGEHDPSARPRYALEGAYLEAVHRRLEAEAQALEGLSLPLNPNLALIRLRALAALGVWLTEEAEVPPEHPEALVAWLEPRLDRALAQVYKTRPAVLEMLKTVRAQGLPLLRAQPEQAAALHQALLSVEQERAQHFAQGKLWKTQQAHSNRPSLPPLASQWPGAVAQGYTLKHEAVSSALGPRDLLATVSAGGAVTLYHLPTATPLEEHQVPQALAIGLNPEGRLLALTPAQLLLLGDNPQVLLEVPTGLTFTALAVQGQRVALGLSDGKVLVHHKSWAEVNLKARSAVRRLVFHPDGQALAAQTAEDANAYLIRLDKLAFFRAYSGPPHPVTALAFPSGQRMVQVAYADGHITWFDLPTGQRKGQIKLHEPALDLLPLKKGLSLAISRDGFLSLLKGEQVVAGEGLAGTGVMALHSSQDGLFATLLIGRNLQVWQLGEVKAERLLPPTR